MPNGMGNRLKSLLFVVCWESESSSSCCNEVPICSIFNQHGMKSNKKVYESFPVSVLSYRGRGQQKSNIYRRLISADWFNLTFVMREYSDLIFAQRVFSIMWNQIFLFTDKHSLSSPQNKIVFWIFLTKLLTKYFNWQSVDISNQRTHFSLLCTALTP